jgi:hypothetical protein
MRISTSAENIYGDLIVADGGAFWRSANEDHFRYVPWESLRAFFDTKGILKSPGA